MEAFIFYSTLLAGFVGLVALLSAAAGTVDNYDPGRDCRQKLVDQHSRKKS
jgi:hypothetical protein